MLAVSSRVSVKCCRPGGTATVVLPNPNPVSCTVPGSMLDGTFSVTTTCTAGAEAVGSFWNWIRYGSVAPSATP